jgi:hypothetical protein
VGCIFADVFNRGRMDLLVTTDSWLSGANYTEAQLREQAHTVEPNVLYENDGGKFKPVADAALVYKSLAHDAFAEDLNHDGRVELYVSVDAESGNQWATSKGGNPLWVRGENGSWQEAAAAAGIKHEANCVCVPAADFDGDGDLDILLVNFYSNPVLYRNETNDKRWLIVKPRGDKTNPDGLGAVVRVFAVDKGQRRLVGTRHVQSGAGYCRSSPLEAHFGLGPAAESYSIEVAFPGGKTITKEGVKSGTRMEIREDA